MKNNICDKVPFPYCNNAEGCDTCPYNIEDEDENI